MAELLRLLSPGKTFTLVAFILLTVVAGLLTPSIAWLTKLLLDSVVEASTDSDSGGTYALAIVVALGGNGIALATYPILSAYWSDELARYSNYRAQERLSAKLASFIGLAPFEDASFHDRVRLAQQGAESAPPVLVSSVASLGRQALSFLGFVAAVATVNASVCILVLLAAAPALVAELAFARRRVRLAFRLTATERRRLFFNVLQTDDQAAKETRLFGAVEYVRERALAEQRSVNEEEHSLATRMVTGRGLLAILGAAGGAGALAVAAIGAMNGSLTTGDVTLAIASIAGVQAAVLGLIEGISRASEAAMKLHFFTDLLQAELDLTVTPEPRQMNPLRECIEFRDVWFRYPQQDVWALAGLNLTINAGGTLALVGPNGSGKSTVVKLLARFYDPDRGSIVWDGVDIKSFDVRELREKLTVVFQDYVEYDLTAAENIALADTPTATARAHVAGAARAAGIDDVVARLPKGYDTMLSRTFSGLSTDDPGVELSGGQWQRIALARMYYRAGAELFILDEPTAALDVESEHRLFRHLTELMADKTNVIISHRMASTRLADVVAVLERGRVVEQGSPQELLESMGTYAYFYHLQEGTAAGS